MTNIRDQLIPVFDVYIASAALGFRSYHKSFQAQLYI